MKRIRSYARRKQRQRRRHETRRILDALAGNNPVQLQVTTVKHTDLAKISVLVATTPRVTRKDYRKEAKTFRALERWLQGNGIFSEKSDVVLSGRWWLRVTLAVPMVSALRVSRELERVALEEYYR